MLLSLLIASAAAIGSYWTWQQSNIRDGVQDRLENGISQLLVSIEKQHNAVDERLKFEQQQRQNYQALQQRMVTLESTIKQASQSIKADRWTIAEALYLINIAEHHYRLEQDSTMARRALERAHEQLLEHNSARTITDALAQLITQLETQDKGQRSQQLSQLEKLLTLIPQLPTAKNSAEIEPSDVANGYSLKSTAGWDHYGDALWHDLQQLFRISRPDAPASEKIIPVSAEIYPILRQQLALKVDFTRLALMNNSPLYITTVKEIIMLLTHYFDADSEVIKGQLTSLEQLVAYGEQIPSHLDFDAVRQQLTGSSEQSENGQ